MELSFRILNEYLNKVDNVVLAISGGPDSMVLLDLFVKYRNIIPINIICAHVNHNLRKESNEEYKFIKEYCLRHNVIFEYYKIENYDGTFTEEKGRKYRYEFFEDILKKYNCKLLFTAHHGDDLIETMMMRIVRGSSLSGYSGFSIVSNKKFYKIIRPLIYFSKEDLYNYLRSNKIPYVIDSSNFNELYTRNRFRHNVLPFLKKEDSNVHKKFLKFSLMLKEYDNYVNKIANKYLKKVYINNELNIKKFKGIDKLIQKNILKLILNNIYDNDIDLIFDKHVNFILNLIYSKGRNDFIVLPKNINVKKSYNKLIFMYEIKNHNDYKFELSNNFSNNLFKFTFLNEEESDSNYVCRLDSKEICMPLFIRNRKNGDKIYVLGLNGSKKIKEVFINEKVDISKRNQWPLLVDSKDNIIWIPGVKKSKYCKKKNDKYDIIIKYECIEEEK